MKIVQAVARTLITIGLFASMGTQQALAAEYSKMTRLGGQPTSICRPAINSAAELQSFALNQSQDVIDILNSAGWPGDPADFFSAVEQGQFVEKSYEVGSRFEWMGQRSEGQAVAKPKKEWAGKQAFSGFELNLISNCQQHTIVIPKACCNVSLVSSSAVTMEKPVVTSSIAGDMVTIKVNGNGESTITELVSPDGSTETLDTSSGSWSGKLSPGTYQVVSKTANDCGESGAALNSFTVAAAAAVVEAVSLAKSATLVPFVAPFIGYQSREYEDYTWNDRDEDAFAVGVAAGVMYPISDKTSVFTQIGYLHDTDESDNHGMFADVGINQKVSERFFVGGGLGYWNIDSDVDTENSGSLSVFGQVGMNIRDNTQWFAEARGYANGLESQAYLTGLRYMFNK